MYVTGQITGASVHGHTATLAGTANITGLGAGPIFLAMGEIEMESGNVGAPQPSHASILVARLDKFGYQYTLKLRHCADDWNISRPHGIERSSDRGGIDGPSLT